MNFLVISPLRLTKGNDQFPTILRQYLKEISKDITVTRDAVSGMSYVSVEHYDAIWADWDLLKKVFPAFIKHLRKYAPHVPLIVVTGDKGVDIAIALNQTSIFAIIRTTKSVESAKEIYRRLKIHSEILNQVPEALKLHLRPNGFGHFIGNSVPMLKMYKQLAKVAGTNFTVLTLGASGSGKELVAKTIHEMSHRSAKPFVSLNCAAIPENLLESELFGYEKGAFTGANQAKPGKFEMADTGTIFLDEIGDMALPLQAKLLRVLEDGIVERLGSTKGKKVDFRLIAATNQDLFAMVEEGTFRSDLHFRMNVIPINLTPLSNRDDDVLLLSLFLLNKILKDSFHKVEFISWDLIDKLKSRKITGNVRELENLLTRIVFNSDGKEIGREHIQDPIEYQESQEVEIPQTTNGAILPLWEMEKYAIENAISKLDGNISKVSTMLEISRVTLYRKLKKYEIEIQE